MRRDIKKLLKLSEQLDAELEKSHAIFEKQRSFLDNHGEEFSVIKALTDEEIEEKIVNEYTIERLTKELKKLCKT